MITARQKTEFRRLRSQLSGNFDGRCKTVLTKTGAQALEKLKEATPVRTGRTRDSWSYAVIKTERGYRLVFSNSNMNAEGLPVVVLLEYGHGTKNGGYIPARYFIKKTLNPIYAELRSRLKKEVVEP